MTEQSSITTTTTTTTTTNAPSTVDTSSIQPVDIPTASVPVSGLGRRSGPEIEIDTDYNLGNVPTEGKSAARRKNSMFHITMNTNVRPRTRQDAYDMATNYMPIIDEFFRENDSQNIVDVTLISLGNSNDFYPISDEEWNQHIFRLVVKSKAEVGSDLRRGARFHIHTSMYFLHDARLRIDAAALKRKINEVLEINGLHTISYINIQVKDIPPDLYAQKNDY